MRLRSSILTLFSVSMLAFNRAAIAEEPPLDVKDVQQVREAYRIGIRFNDKKTIKRYRYLLHMGEKVFPAYEAILSDPKATPDEIGMLFLLLGYVEADRRPFLKHALAKLADPDRAVRVNAVISIKEFGGTAAEASPVVALLSDGSKHAVYQAANTLVAIGGPNEVVAMDVWLRGISHRDEAELRQHVEKCRDELKKRLDDAKDPKKRSQLRHRCWKHLTGTGEEAVFEVDRAVRELSACGAETVPFLKDLLQPVPVDTQKHLDQLVADLDSDSFERRETASRELSRGIVAEAVLEKALANRPSLEVRKRLKAILKDFPKWREKNPELLRQVHAVWVLQQIGTPEARALLQKLADGAPSAALTQKAKDALQSLDRIKSEEKRGEKK